MNWINDNLFKVLTIVSIFYEDRRDQYTGKTKGPYHSFENGGIRFSFAGLGLPKTDKDAYIKWDAKNNQRKAFREKIESMYDVTTTSNEDGSITVFGKQGNVIGNKDISRGTKKA